MLNSKKVLVGAPGMLVVGMYMLALPVTTLASNSLTDRLRACAAISEASARLACYDGLADRQQAPVPAMSAVPVAAAPVATAVPAEVSPAAALPPDEMGSGSVRSKDRTKAEDAPVTARVIRCARDASKDYVFYLEGGQVWKQTSGKKLSFETCDFTIAISKDVFGYKMQMDGDSRKIRISRIR
jgi:hypothetical protein